MWPLRSWALNGADALNTVATWQPRSCTGLNGRRPACTGSGLDPYPLPLVPSTSRPMLGPWTDWHFPDSNLVGELVLPRLEIRRDRHCIVRGRRPFRACYGAGEHTANVRDGGIRSTFAKTPFVATTARRAERAKRLLWGRLAGVHQAPGDLAGPGDLEGLELS